MNTLYDEHLDDPLPQVDKDGLLAELRLRLPDLELPHAAEDPRPYECDGLLAYRCTPLLMVLPERIEQVQGLLALCCRLKVPIVAHGTSTGLSDGALPLEDGVLLVMTRLWRVLEIDPLGRFARIRPDIRNLVVSQATTPHGLYYAPDPFSQIACLIGGNITGGAGSVRYLKYGLTVYNLLQVDIVTLEGERLSLGSSTLGSASFDLLVLFTGSEGLLGVVVEVTVRLLPCPPVAKVLLTSFDDVESAGRAAVDLIGAGIVPAELKVVDNLSTRAAKDFIYADHPVGTVAILLRELNNVEADVHKDYEWIHELFEAAGSTSVRQAQDEAKRQRFWAGRKNAFPTVRRISPDYYCMDGSIPRRELPRVLHGIAELSRECGLRVTSVFHAGDGNIHPLILFDVSLPDKLERTEALGGRILGLCVAVGGSITGKYGIGHEKVDQICAQFNANELTLFHAMRATFDPAGPLNPGENVPTLHRYAEFDAVHVHHGRLPFPELEHF